LVKFVFSHSKTRKQLFLLTFSKSRVVLGAWPLRSEEVFLRNRTML